MHVINNLELINGLAVLPVQQTSGVGRSNNQVSILAVLRFQIPDYKVTIHSFVCFSGLVPWAVPCFRCNSIWPWTQRWALGCLFCSTWLERPSSILYGVTSSMG